MYPVATFPKPAPAQDGRSGQAADQVAGYSRKRTASLNSQLEKTNAQRNELQTKLDQATSEIKADPETDRQRDLAISQGRVAILLAEQSDAPRALDMFRQGRAISAGLAKQSPDNGQLSEGLTAFDDGIAKLEQTSVPETGSVKTVKVSP